MRDRQLFEKTVLPNGITLYTYQQRQDAISCLEILLPVGSGHAHAGNGFIPGAPHFLEHIQLIRSAGFPEAYQLDRTLGLKAGHGDGTTYPTVTSYWLNTPAKEFEFAVEALVDRVFRPLFKEEDIAIERGVIANERNQRKFYPGKSKASQYYYRDFLCDVFYPLEQVFGSDEDLEATSSKELASLHAQITTSQDIVALAVGKGNFDHYRELLSALPTKKQQFSKKIEPTFWKRREYHEVYFDTISQPTLKVAWIQPRLTYEEFRAVSFILSLLINSTHGSLYQEFREEKGWTYGLDSFSSLREENCLYGLTFPVNTKDQVKYIHSCLADRIQETINNQQLVEDEITRHLCNQVYSYQTASEIITSASADLMSYGCIHTEKEWQQATKAMTNPAWRTTIVEKYFRPDSMGSLCFMPERRRYVQVRELPTPAVAMPQGAATMGRDAALDRHPH